MGVLIQIKHWVGSIEAMDHKSQSEPNQHDAGIGVASGPSTLGLPVLPTPISIRSSL